MGIVCTDCGLEKPSECFSKASGTHKCNPCRVEAERKRVAKKRAEDPDGFKARRSEIAKRCRAKKLSTDPDARRLENEKSRRATAKAKRVDPDGFRSRWRAYREKQSARLLSLNPHHWRDVSASWRTRNPERARELARASYRRLSVDPEFRLKMTDKTLRRKRALRAYPALAPEAWAAICEEHDQRCAYCLRREPLTIDHVIALARGGAHDPSNIVPACSSCNKSKGANGPIELLLKPRLIVTRRMLAAS